MSTHARVLVLGAKGMLGGYIVPVLRAEGHVVVPATRQEFDVLRDPWDTVQWHEYDVVVNAIGAIAQKIDDVSVMNLVNGAFPRAVAPRCRRWIHVSTDCVFSGHRGRYAVTDTPDPIDAYGKSKLAGETGIVLRGTFVGEGEPRTLLGVVLSRHGVMRGYSDHWWNGTTCLEFARAIAGVIRRDDSTGTVHHVAGPDRMSKLDLCRMIAEVYRHPLALTPYEAGFMDRTLVPTWPVHASFREQLREQKECARWPVKG